MNLLSLSVFWIVAGAFSSAATQTVNIDHQPVKCAVAEKFPRLEARFTPADAVATAKVVFQGENKQEWYSVAMKAEGQGYEGILPKPKRSLKAFRYYIEVTDKSLGTNRTTEYTTSVIASAGECKGLVMAATVGSASVALQGVGTAAGLPAGFASSGVVAGSAAGSATGAAGATAGAGGGLSTGALVGIVGGVGAAAGVAVVAAKKGGGSNETIYTGPINGTVTLTQTQVNPGPGGAPTTSVCVFTAAINGTVTARLSEGSGRIEGTWSNNANGVSGSPCGPPASGPLSFTSESYGCQTASGSGNLACTDAHTNTSGGGTNTSTFAFSGALNGGVVSGTVTVTRMGQGGGVNSGGNFTVTNSGSDTFSVTLR